MAEDSSYDAALLEAELHAGGFALDLHRVQTEEQFRAALDTRRWDLVILDYALPAFGARKALAILRERGEDLPAIVVSGTVGEQELVETMRAGAGDYVQKGNLSRLVPAVRRELHEAVVRRERRAAERALRDSEERYRLLFERNPQPMWVYDTETLVFLAVNEAAIHHYGYSPEEFARMTIEDIRPTEDPAHVRAEVAQWQDGLRWAGAARHRKRNGDVIDVEVTSHSLPFAGRRARVVLVNDVTDRMRAEAALRKSEEHFRSLIENASDLIAVLDGEGLIRYESPSIERILGYSPRALDGRSAFELFHPDDAEAMREAFRRVTTTVQVSAPTRARVRHQDGSWRTLEIVAARERNDRGQAGIVLNARDISDRESLEAQLLQSQKIEAVGRLAGGVAHDFNNLITAILGYGDLMMRRLDSDSPLRRHLQEIARAAERAAALTQQLLAFSRKQVLQPRTLEIPEVLERIQGLLARLIGEDIELIVRAAPGVGRVRADPVQLEQVLLNLAINSRDAMPTGGKLVLEAENADLDEAYAREHLGGRPGPFVMLAVSDTGHGMDRETQAHIFEPFFTTKEVGKGTGLGLSTVYGIVKQSGGYVWVYSEKQRGTTFKIYLPRVEQAADRLSAERASARARGSETVLLVEDEESVRELVRELLEAAGYRVLRLDEDQLTREEDQTVRRVRQAIADQRRATQAR
jgi:PAS domain S-box-containing protein